MKTLIEAVRFCINADASDLFIIAGRPIMYKAEGTFHAMDDLKIMPDGTEELIRQAYGIAGRSLDKLINEGDDDFAISVRGLTRLRINAYKQRGSLAAAVRIIPFGIPKPSSISIPDQVMDTAKESQGIIFVSGPAASGKSTTLACMTDMINHSRNGHIITLEDPIEYLHRNDMCFISQREINIDTGCAESAIRHSLDKSPDVLVLDELTNTDEARMLLAAAEAGCLVIASVRGWDTVSVLEMMASSFPGENKENVLRRLSYHVRALIRQTLVHNTSGGMTPAFEALFINDELRQMISEGDWSRLASAAGLPGNISMSDSLNDLLKKGMITEKEAEYRSL